MADTNEKPLYTLWKALGKNNYDVPEDYDDFEYTLTLPGEEGSLNRQQLYKSLYKNNYDVPDNYDDFANTLFVPAKSAQPQQVGQQAVQGNGRRDMVESLDKYYEGLQVQNAPQAPVATPNPASSPSFGGGGAASSWKDGQSIKTSGGRRQRKATQKDLYVDDKGNPTLGTSEEDSRDIERSGLYYPLMRNDSINLAGTEAFRKGWLVQPQLDKNVRFAEARAAGYKAQGERFKDLSDEQLVQAMREEEKKLDGSTSPESLQASMNVRYIETLMAAREWGLGDVANFNATPYMVDYYQVKRQYNKNGLVDKYEKNMLTRRDDNPLLIRGWELIEEQYLKDEAAGNLRDASYYRNLPFHDPKFAEEFGAYITARIKVTGERWNDAVKDAIDDFEAAAQEGRVGQRHSEEYLGSANRGQVDDMLDKVNAALKKRTGELDDKFMNKSWFQRMGESSHDPESPSSRYLTDPDASNLIWAGRALQDAKKIIAAFDANRLEDGLTGFFKGAGRGLVDSLGDLSTWDGGISDLLSAQRLNAAVDKFKKGKPLSASEKALLDATSLKLATAEIFKEVGRGYKAGTVTGESLPFMVEMALNPIAKSGNKIASGLAKYANKYLGKYLKKMVSKLGRSSAGRMATRILGSGLAKNAGRVTARVVGDIGAAGGMAATSGLGHSAASAIGYHTGDVQYQQGAGGKTHFSGVTGGDDWVTSTLKGFGSTTIENASEMWGEYFKPITNFLGSVSGKALEKMHLGAITRWLNDVNSTEMARLMSDFRKQTRWDGNIAEYFEEVAGNIANALTVKDMNFSLHDKDGNISLHERNSVFNVDDNIDTFLGVSLMSGAMGSANIVGYRTPKYRAKQDVKRYGDMARGIFGARGNDWSTIETLIRDNSEEGRKQFVADLMQSGKYSKREKQAALQYAGAVYKSMGMDLGESKQKRSAGDQEAEEAYGRGYDMANLETIAETSSAYNQLRSQMEQEYGTELMERMDSEPGLVYGWVRAGAVSEEDAKNVLDYLNAKMAYEGAVDRLNDDDSAAKAAAESHIDDQVHTEENGGDGQIHPVTLKGREGDHYVVSGNVVTDNNGKVDVDASDNEIVVVDSNGKRKMTTAKDIAQVGDTIDPNAAKAQAVASIESVSAQASGGLDTGANQVEGDETLDDTLDSDEAVAPDGATQQDASSIQAPLPVTEYNQDDLVTVEVDGQQVDGIVTNGLDSNGNVTLYLEEPINGRQNVQLTPEQLSQVAVSYTSRDGETISRGETPQEPQQPQPQQQQAPTQEPAPVDSGEVTQTPTAPAQVVSEEVSGEPSDGEAIAQGTQSQVPTSGEYSVQSDEVAAPDGATQQASAQEQPQQAPAQPSLPVGEDGNADFSNATPQEAHDYIYNDPELDEDEADEVVRSYAAGAQARLDEAQAALKQAEAVPAPKMEDYRRGNTPDVAGYKRAKRERNEAIAQAQAAVDAAQRDVDLWNGVQAQHMMARAAKAAANRTEESVENPATSAPAPVSGESENKAPTPSQATPPQGQQTTESTQEPQAEPSIDAAIVEAGKDTNTEPTDAQKEAGNYKKGHVKIDGFDISIEQPKGSVRSGVDTSGKEWSQKMNNTYGYIRGTEGVDGDHIDVFLSDDIDGWNGTVYVVDQVNNDGSFDEHKVMYGFNSEDDARQAYLSNYEDGWQGLGAITPVSKEEFKKWVDSSHRKTKPFAEYKNVKVEGEQAAEEELTPDERIERARMEALENRAEELAESCGLPVQVARSLDDLSDRHRREVEEQHAEGKYVNGFYDPMTKQIVLFLPDIAKNGGMRRLERTFLHEGVAHGGLRALFENAQNGIQTFDELCDQVWEMMPVAAQAQMMNYIGVQKPEDMTQEKKRIAADEYMAHLAEWGVEPSVKSRIISAIKNALRKIGVKMKLSNSDIVSLLAASRRHLNEMDKVGINSAISEALDNDGEGDGEGVRMSTTAIFEGAGLEVSRDATDNEGKPTKEPLTDSKGNLVARIGGKEYSVDNPVTAADLKEGDKDKKERTVLQMLINDALATKNITEKQADKIYQNYADLLNMYLYTGSAELGGPEAVISNWEWLGDSVFRTIAANGDAQYSYSMDIIRVCKKNEAVIKAMSALQLREGRGATPSEIVELYRETHEDGYQVPCPVCYVFTRYIRNGKYASAAIKGMEKWGDHLPGGSDVWSVDQWLDALDKIQRETNPDYKPDGKNKMKGEELEKAQRFKKQLDQANKITVAYEKRVNALSYLLTTDDAIKAGTIKNKKLELTPERRASIEKELDIINEQYQHAVEIIAHQALSNWIKTHAIEEKNGKWQMREDARKPEDIDDYKRNALDLRLTSNTIVNYPAIQRLRKSGGSAAGKEISFASDNRLGEVVSGLGINKSNLSGYKNKYEEALNATGRARNKARNEARKRFKDATVYALMQTLRGGQRMWSWSDNIERLSPDIAINIMQLQLLGGAMQTYSKQLEGIKLAAQMGAYVNGSLMAKDTGYQEVTDKDVEERDGKLWLKHDITDEVEEYPVGGGEPKPRKRIVAAKGSYVYQAEDGKKYVLIYDDVVGVDPFGNELHGKGKKKGLFQLNQEYDRAGNILVGMNDLHVRAAMADPRVFFIIPWHASGANNHILNQMLNILEQNMTDRLDYTAMQEEKNMLERNKNTKELPEVNQRLRDLWEEGRQWAKQYKWKSGMEVDSNGDVITESQYMYRQLRALIFNGNIFEAMPSEEQYRAAVQTVESMQPTVDAIAARNEQWKSKSPEYKKSPEGKAEKKAIELDKNRTNKKYKEALHYIELHDGLIDWRDSSQHEGDAEWQAQHPKRINVEEARRMIEADEFLSQVLKRVEPIGHMTNGDNTYIYPYEYWQETDKKGKPADIKDADINGKRYVEYCRRMGYKPKFSGRWGDKVTEENMNDGNFVHDPGYWKLLIDRRMYDRNGKYQWLDPVESENFEPDLVNPLKTGEEFNITQVADDKDAEDIAERVYNNMAERDGGVAKVDYGKPLEQIMDEYDAALSAGVQANVKLTDAEEDALDDMEEAMAEEAGGSGVMFSTSLVDESSTLEETAEKSSETTGNGENMLMSTSPAEVSEEEREVLMGIHNITAEKLRSAIGLGGLANPSMAVVDTTKGLLNNFGEISLIPGRDLIDKRKGRNAGTFTADAYTPRFPTVHRRLGKGGEKKLSQWIKSLGMRPEMEYNTTEQFNDWVNGFDIQDNALVYPFLHEKGLSTAVDQEDHNKVSAPFREIVGRYHGDIVAMMDAFDTNEEVRQEITDIIIDDIVKQEAQREEGESWKEYRDRRRKWRQLVNEAYLDFAGFVDHGIARATLEKECSRYVEASRFNPEATRQAASIYIDKNGMRSEYTQWREQRFAELGVEEQMYAGSDSQGRSKYKPITLESVSKAMKKQGLAGGESSFFSQGPGGVRARLTPRLTSLNQIRAERGRIQNDIDEILEGYSEELGSTISNLFGGDREAAADVLTSADMKAKAKELGFEIGDATVQYLQDFKNRIIELPTEYFETKFERPVMLNEFEAAVVPNDVDSEIREALEAEGLDVREYDPELAGDRERVTMEAAQDSGNVLFSTGWHGSGSEFDRFDHSHMGEGEGAQAYGWGTYITSVEGIGRSYATESAKKNPTYYWKGQKIDRASINPLSMAYDVVEREGTIKKAIALVDRFLDNPDAHENWAEVKEILKQSKKSDFTIKPARYLYEVEIPDNNGENYISWNETLPKKHRRRIANVVRELPDDLLQRDTHGPNWLRGGFEQLANTIEREQYAGKEITERLRDALGNSRGVSEIFSKAGFVGTEYPAQYLSGGRKDGAKNYVIYNEDDIEIKDRIRFSTSAAVDALKDDERVWNDLLGKVFSGVSNETRRGIVEDAMRNRGNDFGAATEAWLGGLADDGKFADVDRRDWGRVKLALHQALMDNGVDVSEPLSDGESRYVLWKAGQVDDGVFSLAEDVVMRDRLLSGAHAPQYTDSADVRFSTSESEEDGIQFSVTPRDRAIARGQYERWMKSGRMQWLESMQDSMLGLKKLMQAIMGNAWTKVEDVAMYENPYIAENLMSSVTAAQQQAFYTEFMKPLLEEVGKLCKGGKKAREKAREELTNYLMAKHGLERNQVLADRDAQETAAAGGDYQDAYQENRERDYSGLTSLTGEDDVHAAEAKAQQIVDDYEAQHDTTELWSRINAATQVTLEKQYKSGMLSYAEYQRISDMFEYYVPLRGWEETTSDEVYGYLTSKAGPFLGGGIVKRAEGRTSKADDPIATIAQMGDDSIRTGNRNLMKQTFLNFVQNHPSDAVSVSDLWLQYDAVTDEWIPVFADIDPNDSADVVEQKIQDFEQHMQELAEQEPDKYKHGREAANIPYRVVPGMEKEHQVLVKRNGQTWVLTINGNPRAAQALNGLTNPDVPMEGAWASMIKGAEWVNRTLSALYTTLSPAFIVSNFLRDTGYSNTMVWVRESPNYALRFNKNYLKLNPGTLRWLLGKWEDGTLDESKPLQKHFKEFMLNGGETGFAMVKDLDKYKKDLLNEVKNMNSRNFVRKGMKVLGSQYELLGRSIENCARFAAYMTSREMGRSAERAAYDAKEISVNFNKKGSGGKSLGKVGQTKTGNVGAFVSGMARSLYTFWNAGVQGMTNAGRAVKRHPVKAALMGVGPLYAAGFLAPILAQLMGAGGDGDDDKNAYYNLPEYVRRSNLCIWLGDAWLTIPLPIEFRSIYGMGELTYGVISGNERYSDEELAMQVAGQFSQLLPIDMLEGGGGFHPFIPTLFKPLVEAEQNKSWSGLPIYRKSEWNKDDPEYTKAFSNANEWIVSGAEWLNAKTGGDEFKKGWLDLNPAKIEYMLKGYLGGIYTTIDEVRRAAETALGERDFEWRNIPLANRVIKQGDERTESKKLRDEYFKYKEDYENTKHLINKYKNAENTDLFDYAKKLDLLNNSKEYGRYLIFEKYATMLEAYQKAKKGASGEVLKKIEEDEKVLMRQLVDEMHAFEDGKITVGNRPKLSKKDRSEDYGYMYNNLRTYVDINEDALLDSSLKRAKASGDKGMAAALSSIKRSIGEMKKGLGRGNDDKVMDSIRRMREGVLRSFGLLDGGEVEPDVPETEEPQEEWGDEGQDNVSEPEDDEFESFE